MAALTLELVVDILGTNPEDRTFGFEFKAFPEVVAGDTLASAVVEYAGAPALTLPAAPSVAGTVVGTQVQLDYEASLACVGKTYAVCCTATTAAGKKLIVRGRLEVTGSQ